MENIVCCHLESCEDFRGERFLGKEFEGVRITELQASNSISHALWCIAVWKEAFGRSSVASI